MNNGELPQLLESKVQLSRFLDGELVVYSSKNLMAATEGRPGYITCSVCQKDFKFHQCARVLEHVLCDKHQKNCRDKLEAAEKAVRQAVLQDACTTAASKLITIHKHVHQHINVYTVQLIFYIHILQALPISLQEFRTTLCNIVLPKVCRLRQRRWHLIVCPRRSIP